MEGSDELRAALERRQADGEGEARRLQALDRKREGYEHEEAQVKAALYAAADQAAESLSKAKTPTQEVAVTPKPYGFWGLFERQKFAVGWEVTLNHREQHVLCPDGTLIRRQLSFKGQQPQYWTLEGYLRSRVDEALRNVRRGTSTTEITTDYYAEAFGSGYGSQQGQDRQVQALHARLMAAKSRSIETFADVLHQVGVSLS